MALQDFIYRLKAQAGDTTPHDEGGVSGDLSGGTITLVDRGSGDYVWQFAGAASSVGTPEMAFNSETIGTGGTFAVRMAVTDYGTGDFDNMVCIGSSTGLRLEKSGTNKMRARYTSAAGAPAITVGTSIRTIVVRLIITASQKGKVEWWLNTSGRVGTAPDGSTTDLTLIGPSISISGLTVGTNNETIQLSDAVIWSEALSDVMCASMADTGIRETLDSSSSASIEIVPNPASVVVGTPRTVTIDRSIPAPAGAGVTYNITSSNTSVATVPASMTMAAGADSKVFDITGVSAGSATITVTNAADSNETATVTANVIVQRKLKLLAHIDALGATAVKGAVFQPPTGGALVGAKIGEFTGAAFKTTSESGQAPLEVAVGDFGGTSLTTADTPVVVWEGTSSAGSALGNAVPIGSVGPHECTVIEV